MNINSYCTYYTDLPTDNLPIEITPVFAGLIKNIMIDFENDTCRTCDTLNNNRYGELSVLYKIWKDFQYSDIVYFCHYRRFFNFGKNIFINSSDLFYNLKKYKIFDKNLIEQYMIDYDFIMKPRLKLIHNESTHYFENHNFNDYCKMISLLTDKYPDMYNTIKHSHILSNSTYYGFIMITKWSIFNDYCKFLFENLAELEKIIPEKSDTYQRRDLAFLGERISDIYLKHNNFKIKELPIIEVKV